MPVTDYIDDRQPRIGLRTRLGRALIRYVLKPRLNPAHTIPAQRRFVERMNSVRNMPRAIRVRATQTGGVPAEAHDNRDAGAAVLLFIHGGAFVLGSPASHRELIARLAVAGGMQALAPDYRLAPEHPFPAALDDVLAVYRRLLADGQPPSSIILGGDSAGGCLALQACQRLRDAGQALPAGLLLLSPGADLTGSGETMTSMAASDPMIDPAWVAQAVPLWLGGMDAASAAVSPLFGDCRGLPPTLIQVGTEEMLLSDAERLAAKLHAAGVDVRLQRWHGLWHDFQMLAALVPAAREAIDSAGAFMQRCRAR